jgi:predicted nucleic acid-binding protein
MRVYADSSFILRLVTSEPGSAAAIAEYRRLNRPGLFYLPLHALEVENAIRQRDFHERRTRPAKDRLSIKRERAAAIARLNQLCKRGALNEVTLDMDSAMDRARELSRKHTEHSGARAIDLLHVSCALLLECDVFLTFDKRQIQIAKAEKLRAPRL